MKYYIVLWDSNTYIYFKEYIDILKTGIKPQPEFINLSQIETYKGDETTFICIFCIPESLKDYPPKNLILVNTEQLSKEYEVQRMCYNTSNNIKIIDYSMANIDIFIKHGKQRHLIHYIPYFPMSSEIFNYDKIHDACIITSSSRRRNLFINEFQNIKVVSGWYNDRDDLLFRHKILVNIHSEDDRTIFESIRCNRCIFNKMIVITEKSNEESINPLKKYMIECDLSEMPMIINKVLTNYDEYYNTLFKDFDLTKIIQEFENCGEYNI
jgi:hypothetical protein